MGNEYDVIIVGAGSSGLMLSYLLPKNLKILILEKNKKVEIKSTGLVSQRFFEVVKNLKNKDLIVNTFDKATLFFPHGNLNLKSKGKMFLLDVKKFGKVLLDLVRKNKNIKLFFNINFIRNDKNKIFTSKKIFRTKVLVGADGPLSKVAEANGIKLSKELFSGSEGIVERQFRNLVELHFDEDLSKKYFSWVVPENKKRARVGIISEPDVANKLNKFLEKRFGKTKIKNLYGDVIRIGVPDRTYFESGFLIGDAAGQVKPYSAGGFTYSAMAVKIATEAIKKAFEKNDFSAEFFKENYEKKWKKMLLPAIKKGYMARRTFGTLKKSRIAFHLTSKMRKIIEKSDLDLM